MFSSWLFFKWVLIIKTHLNHWTKPSHLVQLSRVFRTTTKQKIGIFFFRYFVWLKEMEKQKELFFFFVLHSLYNTQTMKHIALKLKMVNNIFSLFFSFQLSFTLFFHRRCARFLFTLFSRSSVPPFNSPRCWFIFFLHLLWVYCVCICIIFTLLNVFVQLRARANKI